MTVVYQSHHALKSLRKTAITPLRFILASLRYHRWIHLAVALGVAVATAVLTGALLVGDSVRGSLRDLAIDRLGRIDFAIVSNGLFRAELADDRCARRLAGEQASRRAVAGQVFPHDRSRRNVWRPP